jgi:hypothetical protein
MYVYTFIIEQAFLCIWAALLCGYPLLHPYFLPTKNAQRHAVLWWYMYSGTPPMLTAATSVQSCAY